MIRLFLTVLEYKPDRVGECSIWREFKGEIKEIPLEIYYTEDNETGMGPEFFEILNSRMTNRSRGGYSAFIDLDHLFGAGDYHRVGLAGDGSNQSSPQEAIDKVRAELEHAISELIAIRDE